MKDKNSALSSNVIWIFGDQHRAQALSVMEDPNVQTPNIDRLAVSSRTGIAGSPLCSPFRGSLLTSQYPHRCIPGHDIALPNGMPTVATAFSHSGYQTAYIGKWHVEHLRVGIVVHIWFKFSNNTYVKLVLDYIHSHL